MTEPMEDDEDFYGNESNVAPAQTSTSISTSTPIPPTLVENQARISDSASHVQAQHTPTFPAREPSMDSSQLVPKHPLLSAANSIPTQQSSLLSGGSAQHTTAAGSLAPAITATAGVVDTSDQIVGQSPSTSSHGGVDVAQSSAHGARLASDGAHGAVLSGDLNLDSDVAMGETTNEVPQIGEVKVQEEAQRHPEEVSRKARQPENGPDTAMGEAMDSGSMQEPQKTEEHGADHPENGMQKVHGVIIDEAEAALASQGGNIIEVLQNAQRTAEGGAEFEADSSPYVSSSEDSSDSSSDDDSDDDYPLMDPREQARLLMEDGGSDDEGGGKGKGGGPLRTQNEQIDEIVEMPDVTITEDMKIEELGNMSTIVDNVALIKAKTTGEYQVLETSSLLCRQDRTVIGVVSETIGRVEEPMYIVRFTNPTALKEFGLEVGSTVFYVPSHSKFLFTKALHVKGSDASNLHDEEVGDHEKDFSDDEAEQAYKSSLKKAKQAKKAGNRQGPSDGFQQGSASHTRDYQTQSFGVGSGPTELSYDDDNGGEELYTPLARPANLADMMRQNAPTQEQGQPGRGPNGNWRGGESSRGRGRGGRGGRDGDRGRGRGRGRGDFSGRGRGQDRHQQSHNTPSYPQNNQPVQQNQQWAGPPNPQAPPNMFAGGPQHQQPNPYTNAQQQTANTNFQFPPFPVAALPGFSNPAAMPGIQGFPVMPQWPGQQQWPQQPNTQAGGQTGSQAPGQQYQSGGGYANPQYYGAGQGGNNAGNNANGGQGGGYNY